MVVLAISEIKLLKSRKILRTLIHLNEKISTIFCRIPYAGVEGEKLIKNLVRKLKRHIDETFKLKNIDCWKKLNDSCVPEYLNSQIKYEFCCPACNNKYIVKTDQNFGTHVQEHSCSDKKSPVYNHLLECKHFNYVVNLHSLPPSNNLVEYLEHVMI